MTAAGTKRVVAAQLVIECEHRDAATVVTLYGELDVASAPRLERELQEAEGSGQERLVVDLGGLEFMDSTGLHVLLAANRRSVDNGHRLSLLRGPRAVHRIFELTEATEIFRFDE